MRYMLLLMIFPLLSFGECRNKKNKTTAVDEKIELIDSLPLCIRKLIDESNKETPPNPPVKIDAYFYHDKTVYLVTAQCCDFFNMVYDENCKIICAASGGITGKGDGKCEDFSKTAKHVKLVWEKEKQ